MVNDLLQLTTKVTRYMLNSQHKSSVDDNVRLSKAMQDYGEMMRLSEAKYNSSEVP